MPSMNQRISAPLIPGPVKYSLLARKVTLRRTASGMNTESLKEMWLLARIAPPERGTRWRPRAHGSQNRRATGPTTNHLTTQ
jgi:hypothetical protein